jgi:hypothetical protein
MKAYFLLGILRAELLCVNQGFSLRH